MNAWEMFDFVDILAQNLRAKPYIEAEGYMEAQLYRSPKANIDAPKALTDPGRNRSTGRGS